MSEFAFEDAGAVILWSTGTGPPVVEGLVLFGSDWPAAGVPFRSRLAICCATALLFSAVDTTSRIFATASVDETTADAGDVLTLRGGDGGGTSTAGLLRTGADTATTSTTCAVSALVDEDAVFTTLFMP